MESSCSSLGTKDKDRYRNQSQGKSRYRNVYRKLSRTLDFVVGMARRDFSNVLVLIFLSAVVGFLSMVTTFASEVRLTFLIGFIVWYISNKSFEARLKEEKISWRFEYLHAGSISVPEPVQWMNWLMERMWESLLRGKIEKAVSKNIMSALAKAKIPLVKGLELSEIYIGKSCGIHVNVMQVLGQREKSQSKGLLSQEAEISFPDSYLLLAVKKGRDVEGALEIGSEVKISGFFMKTSFLYRIYSNPNVIVVSMSREPTDISIGDISSSNVLENVGLRAMRSMCETTMRKAFKKRLVEPNRIVIPYGGVKNMPNSGRYEVSIPEIVLFLDDCPADDAQITWKIDKLLEGRGKLSLSKTKKVSGYKWEAEFATIDSIILEGEQNPKGNRIKIKMHVEGQQIFATLFMRAMGNGQSMVLYDDAFSGATVHGFQTGNLIEQLRLESETGEHIGSARVAVAAHWTSNNAQEHHFAVPTQDQDEVSTWRIVIESAENLISADANGLSDPYCLLYCGKKQYSTRRRKLTVNPVWKESFLIPDNDFLVIKCFDHDGFSRKDDFLGQAALCLSDYRDGKTYKVRLPLRGVARGTIVLEVENILVEEHLYEVHSPPLSPAATFRSSNLESPASAVAADPMTKQVPFQNQEALHNLSGASVRSRASSSCVIASDIETNWMADVQVESIQGLRPKSLSCCGISLLKTLKVKVKIGPEMEKLRSARLAYSRDSMSLVANVNGRVRLKLARKPADYSDFEPEHSAALPVSCNLHIEVYRKRTAIGWATLCLDNIDMSLSRFKKLDLNLNGKNGGTVSLRLRLISLTQRKQSYEFERKNGALSPIGRLDF